MGSLNPAGESDQEDSSLFCLFFATEADFPDGRLFGVGADGGKGHGQFDRPCVVGDFGGGGEFRVPEGAGVFGVVNSSAGGDDEVVGGRAGLVGGDEEFDAVIVPCGTVADFQIGFDGVAVGFGAGKKDVKIGAIVKDLGGGWFSGRFFRFL